MESKLPELATLLSLRRHLRIIHQLPGRVRIKVGQDLPSLKLPELKRSVVEELVNAVPGIKSYRFKVFARSLTIEYDNQQIADSAWSDFLEGRQTTAVSAIEQRLEALYMEFKKRVEQS